jgi:glutaredoxin
MAKHIIMYTQALCSDCQALKQWMDEQGLAYEARDIKANPEYARELEEKTGKLGVPYLVIDGEWVRGYQPGGPFTPEYAESIFRDR